MMDEKKTPARLIPGEDFYIENGLYVFTQKYLLKRGYCCQSGCRHCPYGFRKEGERKAAKNLTGLEDLSGFS